MRLGVFGGSFDPIHYGHLLLAETCREACRLDEVWLVPAARPPHKLQHYQAPAEQRLEMIRLAVASTPALVASPLEIERNGVSFTVDTLAAIRAQRPADELFLLLGSDSLKDFLSWREPARIARMTTLVVVQRAGQSRDQLERWCRELPDQLGCPVRCEFHDMPAMDLSSSDLRARVAAGQSIRFRTPEAVVQYIERQGLYRTLGSQLGP